MKPVEDIPHDSVDAQIKQGELQLNEDRLQADKEIEKLRTTVENLLREIADRDAKLEASVATANSRLERRGKSVDRVRSYIKWMLLAAWLGSLAAFVGWYWFTNGPVYDAIILDASIVLAALGILFFVIIKRFPDELIADDLTISSDTSRIQILSAAAASVSQDVQSVIRKLFPHLEMLMALTEKRHIQSMLARTFKHALSYYDIALNNKAELSLNAFNSKYEGEEQWISRITEKLGRDLGMSQQIISLCYYDYAGDQRGLRDSWLPIRANRKILSELAHHLLTHRYRSLGIAQSQQVKIESTVDLLNSMGEFSLREFDAVFSTFFVRLSEAKIAVLEALQYFKFEISSDLAREIQDYLPEASQRDEWEREIVQFVARKTKEFPEVIEVIITSKSGDHERRRKAWEKIVNSKEMIGHFADMLIQKQLISVAHTNALDKTVKSVLVDMMIEQEDF